ncbi:SH3 domain-containing protein [Streptomyces sp. ME02-8801-2C]|uniref:SH3 domain-containing protein n=1 Tax=Streptomyces sp. ME02-8801-2C TaxID=3028680 RepID=UPI0029AB1A87|nr:SH3 domain-containing protein [Streptomyces sp. ME02-8801-2C]MDX3456740.1 SH3 domain-containing protein [Streptomyces sp. ME02-8801-2C]
MPSRTALTRLGIAVATTALSAAAIGPALASPADNDWGQQNNGNSWNQQQPNNNQNNNQNNQNNQHNQSSQNSQSSSSWNQQHNSQQQSNNGDWGQHNNSGTSSAVGPYRGVVTAVGGLRLRSAPNRGSAIIRVVPQGAIVNIFCKVGGENVDGNSLWYLLTDGTWAWGAARYINNIGAAPRFC